MTNAINTGIATATISNMPANIRASFMEAFESGDHEKAGELVKIYAMDMIEKQQRMAKVLQDNPRKMDQFSEIILDMLAA